MRKLLSLCFLVFSVVGPALAVEPDEVLADPALEERARIIGRELRCVVCQSQSIEDSNAPLAKDMRIVVRERLVAGDSNDQVFDYLVSRYGDYVLLKPPVQNNTLFLWAAPIIIFTAAAGVAAVYLRGVAREDKKRRDGDPSTSEETAA